VVSMTRKIAQLALNKAMQIAQSMEMVEKDATEMSYIQC